MTLEQKIKQCERNIECEKLMIYYAPIFSWEKDKYLKRLAKWEKKLKKLKEKENNNEEIKNN